MGVSVSKIDREREREGVGGKDTDTNNLTKFNAYLTQRSKKN